MVEEGEAYKKGGKFMRVKWKLLMTQKNFTQFSLHFTKAVRKMQAVQMDEQYIVA